MPMRQFPADWEPTMIPDNIVIDETAYVHSVFCFDLCRSTRQCALKLARGSSVNDGTMFDIGPRGRMKLGEYSMLNGVWCLCDGEIFIGDYTMISWSTVIMDSYRLPVDPRNRRAALLALPQQPGRRLDAADNVRPVRIGRDVWIGFECCIMPGVTIGDGAIVGCRSVVDCNVEPYTVVAGNPARMVRRLNKPEAC